MDGLTGLDRASLVVEDALRTYPMASVPSGLSAGVMARIRRLATKPRFRLLWVDYALALFFVTMAGISLALWYLIPPYLLARLHVQALLLIQQLRLAGLWSAMVGVIVLPGVALLAGVLFTRSRG